jgi:hypothetical protein
MFLLLVGVWQLPKFHLITRILSVGFCTLIVFGVLEQWPKHLPKWLARWALQVAGVALTPPIAFFIICVVSTLPDAPPFWRETDRLGGFAVLTIPSLLSAPWIALAAILRHREALVRAQALTLEQEL